MTEKNVENWRELQNLREFGISQSEPATTNFSAIQNLSSQAWTIGLIARVNHHGMKYLFYK